jgi:RNA polymerase sigma-70 factor (ECF subfamily)
VDIVVTGWHFAREQQRPAPRSVASLDAPIRLNRADSATHTDEMLMQQYQRGDERAFQQLYARHRSSLLRYVRRMSPSAGEEEEIVQETWMAVIQGRERYLARARFVTYLFSIAHRRTMDSWRRRGRLPVREADPEEPDLTAGPSHYEPEIQAINVDLRADLLLAVAALPIHQREAFLLRAEEGLGIDEIAEATGANRETAKSRLRFALNRLRDALESWA